MPFIHMIYVSSATKEMSPEDLQFILEQSNRNNQNRNVTGMLLYKNKTFMQVLEGEKENVENLYALITTDSRHRDLKLLVDEEIEQRNFSEWSMGFVNLEGKEFHSLETVSEFLAPDSDQSKDPKSVKKLLKFFKDNDWIM